MRHAASQYCLIVFLSYRLERMRRGVLRLYNW